MIHLYINDIVYKILLLLSNIDGFFFNSLLSNLKLIINQTYIFTVYMNNNILLLTLFYHHNIM